MVETYSSSGVDVQRAERFVDRLKARSRRPGHEELWRGAGGYAAVYPVSEEKAVAITTDGVGTKLLVALKAEKHRGIGVDLVAMCANDLICVGATPTLFLDYFASGKLVDEVADQIIDGILDGCDQAGMLLSGGETAELPGLYAHGHYDLAGFALGMVERRSLITGSLIRPGQTVIGAASSGIHSNGLSLARKVLPDEPRIWDMLLVPTTIYVKPVIAILSSLGEAITGIAHITGGGWRNLFRLNPQVGYHIAQPLPLPPILTEIGRSVEESEMYRTFNMGMGLCLIVDGQEKFVIETFAACGIEAKVVGEVTADAKTLTRQGSSWILKE